MLKQICNIQFMSDYPESQSLKMWGVPCAYMFMKDKKIVKVGKTIHLKNVLRKAKKENLQMDYVYAVYKAQPYQDAKKDNKVIALFYNIFRLSYEVQKEYDNMETEAEIRRKLREMVGL